MGAISAEHARVITDTMHALPCEVREEHFDEIEADLAGYARQFGLDQFRLIARHLADVLDPDGNPARREYRERQRALNLRQRPDGSVTGSFEGTAEFGEALLTLWTSSPRRSPRPTARRTRAPRRSAATTGCSTR